MRIRDANIPVPAASAEAVEGALSLMLTHPRKSRSTRCFKPRAKISYTTKHSSEKKNGRCEKSTPQHRPRSRAREEGEQRAVIKQAGVSILFCPTTPELCASLHRLRVHRRTQSFAVTNTQRCAAVGGVCSVYTTILICIDTPAWYAHTHTLEQSKQTHKLGVPTTNSTQESLG